jgi:hypothetical protein
MNIKLIERNTQVLSSITGADTFKIPESSFLYMRLQVENLTWQTVDEQPKPAKVQVPEGKAAVVCLNTGKAQFLKLDEKVEIVVLDANEITLDEGE